MKAITVPLSTLSISVCTLCLSIAIIMKACFFSICRMQNQHFHWNLTWHLWVCALYRVASCLNCLLSTFVNVAAAAWVGTCWEDKMEKSNCIVKEARKGSWIVVHSFVYKLGAYYFIPHSSIYGYSHYCI